MDISDRNLYKTIVIMVVTLLLLGGLTSLNGGSLDPTDREIRIIVTDSMDGESQNYPIRSIPTDSLVVVKHLSSSEKASLQIGDVIQFRYGNVLDHHRIIAIDAENGKVTTKGDNARGTEDVRFSDITGKVVGVSHILGVIATVAKDYFFLIIVLIGVVYTAYLFVKEWRKEKAKERGATVPVQRKPYAQGPMPWGTGCYQQDAWQGYRDPGADWEPPMSQENNRRKEHEF